MRKTNNLKYKLKTVPFLKRVHFALLPTNSKIRFKFGNFVFKYNFYGYNGKIVLNKNNYKPIESYLDESVPYCKCIQDLMEEEILKVIKKSPRTALRNIPLLYLNNQKVLNQLNESISSYYDDEFCEIINIYNPGDNKLVHPARLATKNQLYSKNNQTPNESFKALIRSNSPHQSMSSANQKFANTIKSYKFYKLCANEIDDLSVLKSRQEELESLLEHPPTQHVDETKIKIVQHAIAFEDFIELNNNKNYSDEDM